jgi:hypothetical protein
VQIGACGRSLLDPGARRFVKLGVLVIEPVDFVQGGFDRQRPMAIDGCRAATDVATLEHKHSCTGPPIESGGG